jgi:predicted outer membrane repeat protein
MFRCSRPFGPVWSLLKPRATPTVEPLPPRDTPATFTVSTLADAGPGSLRQAVLDANATPGADTLVFAATGTLDLTSGAIPITDALDMQGPGADRLTLRGNQTDRLFTLDDGQPGTVLVTIAGLTLTHGQATDGGALRNDEDLTLTDCTLTNNTATDDGGAILNRGTLTLRRCTLSGNTAGGGGGALYADGFGAVTIRDSRLTGNTAGARGGGLYLSNAGLTLLANTLIARNRSTGDGQGGGGLVARSGADVTLQQVTLAQNQATGANAAGGGILLDAGARLTAHNCPLVFNTAATGGGLAERATLNPQLVSTLVAHNTAASQPDLDGAVDADRCLIAQPAAAVLNPVGGPNVLQRHPLLTPLHDGSDLYLPRAGSPALDAGSNPASLTRDARGVGAAPDIGAVERPAGAPVVVSGSGATVVEYPPDGFGQLGAATTVTPFPDRAGSPRGTRADVDGDGVPDGVFVTGPGGGALVRVVSGRTGQDLLTGGGQDAYPGEDFTTIGLFVAAGDVNGDGFAEIVVSPDQGGGARIQVFRVVSGQLQQTANFFGIDDPDFRGGAGSHWAT